MLAKPRSQNGCAVTQKSIGVRFIDSLSPEPPELIPGVLPAEGVTLISGPTNVGKSLLAIEIVSALTVEGQRLWATLTPKNTIRDVVYLLGEHTAGTVHRLYKRTALPMGRHARIIGPEHLPVPRHVIVRGEPNSEVIEQYQALVKDADLIVVDSVSAFISGANSENDNAAIRNLVDQFQRLGIENNAPVLVLGHHGKPTKDPDGKEVARTSYASRGASSAEDACTTVFYLTYQKEGEVYQLACRKQKGSTIPEKRLLLRNAATLVHKELTSNRPNKEAERIKFREKYDLAAKSGENKTTILRVLAAVDGISEKTAWNHLGETKPKVA